MSQCNEEEMTPPSLRPEGLPRRDFVGPEGDATVTVLFLWSTVRPINLLTTGNDVWVPPHNFGHMKLDV